MKTVSFKIIISVLLSLYLFGCSKETPSPLPPDPPKPPNPPDSPVAIAPAAVSLLSPSDNSACIQGDQADENSAIVDFSWSMTEHADTYTIEIKNLISEETTNQTTNKTAYSAKLEIGMPYSWNVTAVNSAGKGSSPVWKFYLAGVAEGNYAPFPPELISPAYNEVFDADGANELQVSFSWSCSYVDNEIVSYALFVDNKDASTLVIDSQAESSAELTLQRGKSYMWKVIATDKVGHRSISIVSPFEIK